MRNTWFVLAAWIGLLIASCTLQHSESGTDSSTHWLKRCGADDQCGGLSCLCGVCSSECSARSECGVFGPNATCIAGSAASCGGSVQTCDRECERDADCGDGAMTCSEGRCRRRAGSSSPSNLGTTGTDSAPSGPPTKRGAASTCAPQLARSTGTECLRGLGFSWNGSACEEVNCTCEGEDCASVYDSKAECDAAYASCRAPATECSDVPWYRCADHCPGDWNFAGGGRSLAECADGECSFELSLQAPRAPGPTCENPTLVGALFVTDKTGAAQRVVNFDLTPEAYEQVILLSRALGQAALPVSTDCPDCADGDAAWISQQVERSAATQRWFTYPLQRAPVALRAVHAFVQALIDQARACTGDLLYHCVTDRALGVNDIREPSCNTVFEDAACECPVSFEQLSTINGTPCAVGCDVCQVPDSTCGARCMRACEGGPRLWDVFCSE